MFYYIYIYSSAVWVGPMLERVYSPRCSLQYTLIILDWELGQRQGKGGGFGNTLIIVQGASSYALAASGFQDFEGYLTFIPRSVQIKGVCCFYLLRGIAECHSEFMTSWEMVWYEACKSVLRQSVPFCLKELDLFYPKWTHITHPFLPHPPLTRHAIGMKGVTQVEQDGFTSANVGNKTSTGEVAYFCLDAGQTTHVVKISCFLTDTLSLPCDPHWQGGLSRSGLQWHKCSSWHSLLRIPTGTLNSGCTIM